MKRFLLAIVLAAALFGLLASPALAAKPVSVVPYPPTNVPVLIPVFPLNGEWALFGGAAGSPTPGVPGVDGFLYQAADRNVSYPSEPNAWPDVAYRPIPLTNPSTDNKVIMTIGWIGSIYGQINNVPKDVPTTIDIVSDDGSWSQHFGPADTAPNWTGPTAWDQWWTDWLNYAFSADPPFTGPPLPFNPKISAGVYFNHLYQPVGPFPKAGLYHLYVTMDSPRPANDLTYFDPVNGPWPHGVFKPGNLYFDNYPDGYSFYVAKVK
jgi:hypothetical protein